VPRFIKEDKPYKCKLCGCEDFEQSFVDDGLTYVLICQDFGHHQIELEVLQEIKDSEINKIS
jgi:hypothetical protein